MAFGRLDRPISGKSASVCLVSTSKVIDLDIYIHTSLIL